MPAYAYALNNPLGWFDLNGLDPGDRFGTADAAARDARSYLQRTYGDELQSWEFGGTIIQHDDGLFYATSPIRGRDTSCDPGTSFDGTHLIAAYHNHPTVPFIGKDGKWHIPDLYNSPDVVDLRWPANYILVPNGWVQVLHNMSRPAGPRIDPIGRTYTTESWTNGEP